MFYPTTTYIVTDGKNCEAACRRRARAVACWEHAQTRPFADGGVCAGSDREAGSGSGGGGQARRKRAPTERSRDRGREKAAGAGGGRSQARRGRARGTGGGGKQAAHRRAGRGDARRRRSPWRQYFLAALAGGG